MSNRNVIKNQALSIARKNLCRANFVEIGERTIIENQAFGIFNLTIRKMLIKRENLKIQHCKCVQSAQNLQKNTIQTIFLIYL